MDRNSVAAIAALDDDVRRALYLHVCAARGPVTRAEAARGVGISRKLAAFHLDKLVEHGLLQTGFVPPEARRVGRAPRTYEPVESDVAVRLPAREPELLAAILIDAVTGARPGEDARDAALRVAEEHGVALGATERARVRPGRLGVERAAALTQSLLAQQGFEPDRDGTVTRLRNCPFHPLAVRAREFVCGANHAYLRGVLVGLKVDGVLRADLSPPSSLNRQSRECCIELRGAAERPTVA
jgi:predicted ArsR family transcriptional regulator